MTFMCIVSCNFEMLVPVVIYDEILYTDVHNIKTDGA